MYDEVKLHVRSLKSLGVSFDTYGSLLASVLVNKLPQELQLIVTRKLGGDDWDLDTVMKIMEEEVQACERMAAVSTTSVGVKKSVMAGGSGKGPTCSYCQQAHSSNSCRTVTQPEARKTILQKSGRCFVCLRRGHISCERNSRLNSYRCNGSHHVCISNKNQDMPPSNGSH